MKQTSRTFASLISQSAVFDGALNIRGRFGNQDSRGVLLLRNDETRV